MKDSLIVLSGGLDSTTMLYEYQHRIAMAVSFHYGSNHNDNELAFAKLHCDRLGIPHMTIRLPFIKQFFKSSLLEGADAIPEGNYDEENMKSTVVPFRNGIMLSIAAGIAENNKLQYVMLANHAGDHAIYPDCRPEFVEAMNNAIHFGTWNGVQLLTPYTHLTKAEIAPKEKNWALTMLRHGAATKAANTTVASVAPVANANKPSPKPELKIRRFTRSKL